MYVHAIGIALEKQVLIVVSVNILTTKIKQIQVLHLSKVTDMNHPDLLISA